MITLTSLYWQVLNKSIALRIKLLILFSIACVALNRWFLLYYNVSYTVLGSQSNVTDF